MLLEVVGAGREGLCALCRSVMMDFVSEGRDVEGGVCVCRGGLR